jgi:hypothetical protein
MTIKGGGQRSCLLQDDDVIGSVIDAGIYSRRNDLAGLPQCLLTFFTLHENLLWSLLFLLCLPSDHRLA